MSSIPGDIQYFGSMTTVTPNGVAHPEPLTKKCRHVPHLDPEAPDLHAIAGLIFVGLGLPANATFQQESVRSSPICQRDCRSCLRVPQHEAVSVWERQQRQFDQELDRKLIICRGC